MRRVLLTPDDRWCIALAIVAALSLALWLA